MLILLYLELINHNIRFGGVVIKSNFNYKRIIVNVIPSIEEVFVILKYNGIN